VVAQLYRLGGLKSGEIIEPEEVDARIDVLHQQKKAV